MPEPLPAAAPTTAAPLPPGLAPAVLLPALLGQVSDAVVAVDAQKRVVVWNSAAERLSGVPAERALGRPLAEVFPYRWPLAEEEPAARAALAAGAEWQGELLYPAPTGATLRLHARVRRLCDARGEPLALLATLHDLTAQATAEQRLRHIEHQLRAFTDANVIGMLFGDIHGGIRECNDELLRIIGHSRDDVHAGRLRWTELTPPEWLPHDARGIAEAQARGACTPYEKEYLRPDGTRVPVLVGYTLLGEPREQSVAFILDLTRQKQVERALHLAAERFRVALQAAPVTVSTCDLELRYTWIYNPHPAFPIAEVLGRRDDELAPAAEVAELVAVKQEVLRRGRGVRREVCIGVQGEPRYYDIVAEPLHDTHLQLVGVTVAAVDVTERQHAAAERERLLAAEQEARQALELANQAKSDFLAVVSHELRTPLNAVLGYADLLEMGVPEPLPASAQRHIARIQASAQHLLQIIEEILTFSRLEAGLEPTTPETLATEEVLQEASAIIEPLAARKGLSFHLRSQGAPPRLHTDARKLRQILINLLGNAVKFTTAGEVALEVEAAEGGVVFRVSDTGAGMDAAELERIFDPFWQADQTSRRVSEGTGLGLAISRRFARLLGGEIRAESRPGAGSTFTVWLPQ